MIEVATLGGGCFWCTEVIFKRLKGVESVTSGYAGGQMDKPSYEDVTAGSTGHAESVQIKFDTKVITYQTLLKMFFKFHDPTTKNRQGADVGTQYRSIIFFHDQKQKDLAEKLIQSLQSEHKDPIVTELVPFKNFYTAEEYHQNFYAKNPTASYCQIIIEPKVQKLLDEFKEYLK